MIKTAFTPEKPVMVWDDDCSFCQTAVKIWSSVTKTTVRYLTIGEGADRFKDLSVPFFKKAIALIDEKGLVFTGAEAVFKTLTYRNVFIFQNLYDKFPLFRSLSESVYTFFSRNRYKFSRLVIFLKGHLQGYK